MMLVDTDVLIWHLRGYPQATRRLDQLGALTLSAISWLEVLQGMRNRAELVAVKKMLDKRSARLLPVAEAITLERRLLAIEKLDPKAKRQITQLLDTFIEREKLKQRVNAQGA